MLDLKLGEVSTKIVEVQVFTSRAIVLRQGKIALDGGLTELVVTGLPGALDSDSIRVSGAGTVPVKIIGVRTEKIYRVETIEEKLNEVDRQLETLREQTNKLDNQIAAVELQREFVKGLSEKSVKRFSEGLARQKVDLPMAGNLLEFLAVNWNKLSEDLLTLEKEKTQLANQITMLEHKQQQLAYPERKESFSLFATVEAGSAADFTLEVSYALAQASWKPLYDLRVDTTTSRVNLLYLAEITQYTGENWSNVQLILSTAKPGLGSLPPKLSPWYLDISHPFVPQSVPMRARTMAKFSEDTALSFGGGKNSEEEPELRVLAAPVMSMVSAQAEVAGISKEGNVVTFKIPRASDIPTDGQPHKSTIFTEDYDFKFEYITMPKLILQTYLRALVTNGSAQLLAGQANIFRDNNFIGKIQLSSIAPGEDFKLNLGVDESVKVERELIDREVDKTFLGNQRRITYTYRITLTNLRDVITTVELSDQLPVSRNEQIKVKLIRSQPTSDVGELGLLEWKLSLAPRTKREITFQFSVEHPRELNLVGLEV